MRLKIEWLAIILDCQEKLARYASYENEERQPSRRKAAPPQDAGP